MCKILAVTKTVQVSRNFLLKRCNKTLLKSTFSVILFLVMSYLQTPHRRQETLFPIARNESAGVESAARFVEAFVASLDLAEEGFEVVVSGRAGRPGYAPEDLVKLCLYGELEGIFSSRRLAREANENHALAWLLRGLVPSYKTIAEFRKKNRLAWSRLLRKFRRARQPSCPWRRARS